MEKKYRITLTETQLRLMIDAVEDWHRFLAGQCEMSNATSYIEPTDNMHECREILRKQIHPLVTPRLSLNASYGWSGSTCSNEHQRKAIAMSYMLYRESLHFLTINSGEDMSWNVYNSETLTCPEQGDLIKIEEVK